MLKVSIIIPTKNNGDILDKCLASIQNLDYPKDKYEVIIVDGHSTDNTVEIAKKYGCKVVYEDIGTRGGACNVGVRNAGGEIVCFTDADCVVDRKWLRNLVKHFNNKKVASVGGPNLTPEDDTEFARSVGEVLSFLSKPGARYGLNIDRVVETFHNSGCNVAYRKRVIEEVGGFNEKLITCEDEELDYRIKEKGYKILYIPDAVVYHYRRPNWKSFFKMAYKYAVGRMQAIKMHREMGRWYHWIVFGLTSLIILLLALFPINPIFPLTALSILVAGGIGISLMSLYLAIKTKMRKFLTYWLLIAIWFWGSGFGYLRGLVK